MKINLLNLLIMPHIKILPKWRPIKDIKKIIIETFNHETNKN